MRRFLGGLRTLALGALFAQFALTALVVVGWVHRRTRYGVLTRRGLASDAPAPNWLRTESNQPKGRLRGLRENIMTGAWGVLNVWAVTLFPFSLMALGWYAGWDNSFNKGYEQFDVGVQVSLLGIVLFLFAMMWVPFALGRQIVTGSAAAFWEFKHILPIAWRHPARSLAVALALSALCVPVTLLKLAPYAIGNADAFGADATPAEIFDFLRVYFLMAGAVGFLAYWSGLRWFAFAYVDSVIADVRNGQCDVSKLTAEERAWFPDAEPTAAESKPRTFRTPRAALRAATYGLVLAAWFSFIAQIYLSEFINYHPVRGWMNQPTLHVPWFRYIPAHLAMPGE